MDDVTPETEETKPADNAETKPEEAAPEEEAAKTEEAEAKADDAEGAEGEEGEKPEAKTDGEKHKRAGGFQRKIERLERQNAQLIEQLAARGGQAPTAAKEKSAEEKAAEYVKTMAKQVIAEEREAQHQAQAQAEFVRRTQEVRAQHPDFDEALEAVAHIPVPAALNEALLTSEHGPSIMYSLATNPAELARISALPPLAAAREVGRLEAKLASGAAPQKPKAAIRPPAPPTSAGGSGTSTRSLEDLPLAEYKRRMRSGR